MIPVHEGDDREVFADGNMSMVVREGDSVFRTQALWADAVHQVLRHLEHQGIDFAPRLRGSNGDQEELSYMPGISIPADLVGFEDESFLIQLGTMIGRLHKAMNGFALSPGTATVPMQFAPSNPSIICHCDIGPWNTIVSGGQITGLIDWDLVAPGTPEWDLAYAAWRFAPLYPEGRSVFSPSEQARRIVILLDAYELPAARRDGFVQLILQRMQSAVRTVDVLGRQRVPGFSTLYDNKLHLGGLDDRKWLQQHQTEMVRIIE